MTKRKDSPKHDYWHPRIEGAINTVILAHPNWFRFRNTEEQRTCVNSLAKRLVGVIVGSERETAMRDQMLPEAHADTEQQLALPREQRKPREDTRVFDDR